MMLGAFLLLPAVVLPDTLAVEVLLGGCDKDPGVSGLSGVGSVTPSLAAEASLLPAATSMITEMIRRNCILSDS